MAFDRTQTKDLRNKLEAALVAFGQANGVTVQIGTLTIRPEDISGRLTIKSVAQAAPGASPLPAALVGDPLANDFVRNADRYGMKAADLGRSFQLNGSTVTLVGAKPQNTKYPLIVKGPQGGRYKCSPEDLRRSERLAGLGGPRRPEAEILEDLRRVEGELSPENLHGDGEYSALFVRRRLAELKARQARLVAELGRTPTDVELYARS